MHHFTNAALFAVLALSVALCYGSVQVQMPEAAELNEPAEDDLQGQIKELQKNVTSIWNYISQLRSAVSHHLTHLRQHQVDLETAMHRMEHLHESELQSSATNHHSGEHHSHSGEHHSHGDDHSHGNDHSHGSTDGHSHSGEQHSHSGEHHSHSGEHGHHSHSYSYSHSSHDHSKEDSHSHGSHDDHHDHDHGHDHKDSHETEDLQQTQKVDPVAEPIVTATTRQEHYHHHHQSYNSDSMNLLNEHSHHHHHDYHHDSRSSNRNRTVVLPKYSEYGLYDLAICRVQPNSALSEDQKQNIFGTITMWQKKTGGPLNLHVRLQGFDVGDHHAHHQQTIQTEEDNETPQPVGHTHGFHVHASGDLSNGCQSTGPHYNPKGVNHGKPGPDSLSRHVGDLGNIACDEHGYTNIVFSDDVASLRGQYSIVGKAIVIHAKEDDLGLGGDAESLKTGNAGTRLACCVIQSVDKIPIRQYKSMKTATQRPN